MYWTKTAYVQELDKVLRVREDHKALIYQKNKDGEYITLSDVIGNVWYFDVTNYDESRILQTIVTVLAGAKPCNLITDTARLMGIAKAGGSTLIG